jgi:lipopolysaccharide biosynthesis glycosyltransferase
MQTSSTVTNDSPTHPYAKQPVIVVCAADDGYSMPLAVTASSALENLSERYSLLLYVIDGGIQEHNKQKIIKSLPSGRCDIRFLPKPDVIAGLAKELFQKSETQGMVQTKHILSASGAAYYRLFIPELLPDTVEKAIYLDCDLVVRGDLAQLWETSLEDQHLLAVQELWMPYVSIGLVNYKELNIPGEAKYFNSGVLVMNLNKWRSDRTTDKALDYLKHNQQYLRCYDQDVLNAVLAEQWGELDHRWNVSPAIYRYPSWRESPVSEETFNSLIHDPYIIHYSTPSKPWSTRHTGFSDSFPFNHLFFNYIDKTVWKGWRLTFWRLLWFRMNRKLRQTKARFGL